MCLFYQKCVWMNRNVGKEVYGVTLLFKNKICTHLIIVISESIINLKIRNAQRVYTFDSLPSPIYYIFSRSKHGFSLSIVKWIFWSNLQRTFLWTYHIANICTPVVIQFRDGRKGEEKPLFLLILLIKCAFVLQEPLNYHDGNIS